MDDPGTMLSIRGVTKRFGPTRALDGVSFDVAEGTIHGLLGANGSGKSTLVKILAGVVAADSGELMTGTETYDARSLSPMQSRRAGFRFVHQQNSTFSDLTVAENIAIGHRFHTNKLGRVRWRAQRRHAAEVLDRLLIDAHPDQLVSALTPAKRTMVAIARALQDAKKVVLVLDEPTASLPLHEVDLLLSSLRQYAARGETIIYVSHRLDEVLDVVHSATVLRNGRDVGTKGRNELTHTSLVELIIGRQLTQIAPPSRAAHKRRVVLESRGIRGGTVQDASFSLGEGEVLGITGLLGSGRTTLLRLMFGAARLDGGKLLVQGQPVRFGQPRHAIQAGIAYVPEDRVHGAFADLSVAENLSMATVHAYWRRGRLRHRAERSDARELIGRYQVRAASVQTHLASLSGGNQQKIVLARWLRLKPQVLLLDEPTQGVDVEARAEIYSLVREAVRAGTSVILVASDLEELALLCDRLLVLQRGRVVNEVHQPITATQLNGLLCAPMESSS